jgi:carbonic anhydrase/acetyltransferase-like protein (isoleucine patch superfamily)
VTSNASPIARIHPTAFIHEEAVVIGNVTLGARASVWPTAVLRGDGDAIEIGAESNVQDGAVLHVDVGVPVKVGDRVTIGHRAIVHGATVEDDCMIGMGAIVLNRAHIGKGSLIGAGAVVSEGMQVPAGSVVLGVPGRIVKEVGPAMAERMRLNAQAYVQLLERHRAGEFSRVIHPPGGYRAGPEGRAL